MYYAHFGLTQPPFKITPNTEFFFSGGNRGAILDALMYAVTSGEGIVKVVGEVGSGKTMLCRMLQTLLPANVESIYLANPSVAPEDVLHAIAFELQLNIARDADRLQVMQVLQKHLLDRHAEGKQMVIFVEEAQGMPLATLEEIRLLSNLETKYDKLLQIVLFGQPELDVNLNSNHIRQLRERITHSFKLGPLDEKAIGDYIIFRLRAAGYFGPHLFDKKAIALIAKAAEGLVRRVNILADKALLAAYAENVYHVSTKHVKAAIKDSEFGAEYVKGPIKSRTMTAIIATLVFGLSAGYLLNQWLPTLVNTVSAPSAADKSGSGAVVKPQALVPSAKPLSEKSSPEAAASTLDQPVRDLQLQTPTVQTSTPPAGQTFAAQAAAAPVSTLKPALAAKPLAPALPVTSPKAAQPAGLATTEPVADAPKTAAPKTAAAQQNATVDDSTNGKAAVEVKPANEAVPTPPQASAAGAAGLLQQRLQATQSWLKQQPESTVTIQLLGSADDVQLTQHLALLGRQLDQQSIYPVRTQVAGQPFITVLYGNYANRQQAAEAINNLPNTIKSYNPRLRTVGGILKETNQFQ